MIILITYILLIVLSVKMARKRDRSRLLFFVFSLCLSPFISILLLLIMGPKQLTAAPTVALAPESEPSPQLELFPANDSRFEGEDLMHAIQEDLTSRK